MHEDLCFKYDLKKDLIKGLKRLENIWKTWKRIRSWWKNISFAFLIKERQKCFKGNYFFASFEAHAVWGQFSAQKHPCATSALDIWKKLKKGIWKDLK